MPAVVTMATVAEPWATRSTTEIGRASRMAGRPTSLKVPASASAMPLPLRTAPKTPPAPTTSRMLPTGLREEERDAGGGDGRRAGGAVDEQEEATGAGWCLDRLWEAASNTGNSASEDDFRG